LREADTIPIAPSIPQTAKRAGVVCHVCSSKNEHTYLEARGFRIAQCDDCKLWFVNPQPTEEELRTFYATYDDGEQWRNREEYFNRGVRKAILRIKRSGSVLDVGCGSGNFLRCMKEVGFSGFGIEPSASGSEYARAEHGIGIYHGTIEDYFRLDSTRRFDVITLLNVLEHLMAPDRILGQLRHRLESDGVLAVVVPDARFHDLIGRLRRCLHASDPYWLEQPKGFLAGFKLPDHLCSFQPATVVSLLRRCGLQVVSVESAPVVFNGVLLRDFAKLSMLWMSRALHYVTFRRILLGYSTLVLARRTA
jgi:SAM-dependent methyltransferase